MSTENSAERESYSFEDLRREIDKSKSAIADVLRVIEAKVGPVSHENITEKTRDFLSADEIEFLYVTGLADRNDPHDTDAIIEDYKNRNESPVEISAAVEMSREHTKQAAVIMEKVPL